MDGLDLKDVPEFLYELRDRGRSNLSAGPVAVRVDGARRLEIWLEDDPRGQRYSDGTVDVEYVPLGKQVSVNDQGTHIVTVHDLCFVPLVRPEEYQKWQVVQRKRGRVTLAREFDSSVVELDVDEGTGFVFASRFRAKLDGSLAGERLQFEPVADKSGRIMPTVTVEARFDGEQLVYCTAYFIARFNFEETFTDADFAISVPAGTQVVDFRRVSQASKPRVWFAQEQISDVLAFANSRRKQ